jgi:nucleotide-binding universal stress UspA family protein
MARLVFGSVADEVLRSAPCPGLVIRSHISDPCLYALYHNL